MYSLNYNSSFLCFKTNDAGYVYWWIIDGKTSFVKLMMIAAHTSFQYKAASGPGINGFEGLRG